MSNVEYIDANIFAARIKDKDVLCNSSSGGMFTVFSDYYLNSGYAIVASVYDYDKQLLNFRFITTKDERDKAIGSKYIQSKPGDIFRESYRWLIDNPEKKLMFFGMGCQADGFRKYIELKGLRNRVIIIDIICHGVPSPKIWNDYARLLEKRHHGNISFLSFKDKRGGWLNPTAYVRINDQEVFIEEYIKLFFSGFVLRPICYECPYAKIDRLTDITIGDFWHIEKNIPDFYNDKGNSMVIIHTNRGMELFEKIRDDIDYQISTREQCWQKNLESPTEISKYRDTFWRYYHKKGIKYIEKYFILQKKYRSFKQCIKNIIGYKRG